MLSRKTVINVVLTTTTISIVLFGIFVLIESSVQSGWRGFVISFAITFPICALFIWLNIKVYRQLGVTFGDAEETRRAIFTAASCLCFMASFYAVFADDFFDHLYNVESIGTTGTARVTAPIAAAAVCGFLLVAVVVAYLGLTRGRGYGRWEMVVSALFLYPPIGMCFAALYRTIPHSLSHLVGQDLSSLDYVFFSYTTLSTTGYGDLTATGGWAKILAVVEQFAGGYLLLGFFVTGALALPLTVQRRDPLVQPTNPPEGVLRADDL
jgi:hypothetical protein